MMPSLNQEIWRGKQTTESSFPAFIFRLMAWSILARSLLLINLVINQRANYLDYLGYFSLMPINQKPTSISIFTVHNTNLFYQLIVPIFELKHYIIIYGLILVTTAYLIFFSERKKKQKTARRTDELYEKQPSHKQGVLFFIYSALLIISDLILIFLMDREIIDNSQLSIYHLQLTIFILGLNLIFLHPLYGLLSFAGLIIALNYWMIAPLLLGLIIFVLLSLLSTLLIQQKRLFEQLSHQAYQSILQYISQDLIFKDMHDGIALLNKNLDILFSNEAAQAFLKQELFYQNIRQHLLSLSLLDHIKNHSKTNKNSNGNKGRAFKELIKFSMPEAGIHIQIYLIQDPLYFQYLYLYLDKSWLNAFKQYLNLNFLEQQLAQEFKYCYLLNIEHDDKYQQSLQEKKLIFMGQLAASIAHEIRNPLASINNAYELMREESFASENINITQNTNIATTIQHKLDQIIIQNIKRIDDIIENILNISRPKQQKHLEKICINHQVEKIIHNWLEQLKLKKNKSSEIYNNQFIEHLIFLNLGKPQYSLLYIEDLRYILENLLDNAWRFCQQKQSSIAIFLRENQKMGHHNLELWVVNDGEVIDSALQQLIFEPFFTDSKKIEAKYIQQKDNYKHHQNSGLGLYISKMLAAQNNIHIDYMRHDLPFNRDHGFVLYLTGEENIEN